MSSSVIRDSSVTIVTSYGLDTQGAIPGRGNILPLSSQHPDRLWGELSLYPIGTGGSLPGCKEFGV